MESIRVEGREKKNCVHDDNIRSNQDDSLGFQPRTDGEDKDMLNLFQSRVTLRTMATQAIILKSLPNYRKEQPLIVTNTFFVSNKKKIRF